MVILVVVVDRWDITPLNFKYYSETTQFSEVTLKNSGRDFPKVNREEVRGTLSLTLPGLSTPAKKLLTLEFSKGEVTLAKLLWGHKLFLVPLVGKQLLKEEIRHGIKKAYGAERSCQIFKTPCTQDNSFIVTRRASVYMSYLYNISKVSDILMTVDN